MNIQKLRTIFSLFFWVASVVSSDADLEPSDPNEKFAESCETAKLVEDLVSKIVKDPDRSNSKYSAIWEKLKQLEPVPNTRLCSVVTTTDLCSNRSGSCLGNEYYDLLKKYYDLMACRYAVAFDSPILYSTIEIIESELKQIIGVSGKGNTLSPKLLELFIKQQEFLEQLLKSARAVYHAVASSGMLDSLITSLEERVGVLCVANLPNKDALHDSSRTVGSNVFFSVDLSSVSNDLVAAVMKILEAMRPYVEYLILSLRSQLIDLHIELVKQQLSSNQSTPPFAELPIGGETNEFFPDAQAKSTRRHQVLDSSVSSSQESRTVHFRTATTDDKTEAAAKNVDVETANAKNQTGTESGKEITDGSSSKFLKPPESSPAIGALQLRSRLFLGNPDGTNSTDMPTSLEEQSLLAAKRSVVGKFLEVLKSLDFFNKSEEGHLLSTINKQKVEKEVSGWVTQFRSESVQEFLLHIGFVYYRWTELLVMLGPSSVINVPTAAGDGSLVERLKQDVFKWLQKVDQAHITGKYKLFHKNKLSSIFGSGENQVFTALELRSNPNRQKFTYRNQEIFAPSFLSTRAGKGDNSGGGDIYMQNDPNGIPSKDIKGNIVNMPFSDLQSRLQASSGVTMPDVFSLGVLIVLTTMYLTFF